MLRIILNGCYGRMGQVLQQQIAARPDLTVVAGIDRQLRTDTAFPVYTAAADIQEEADVVIDFSHDVAIEPLLAICEKKQLPVVIATTGLTEQTKERLQQASQNIPVFYSANMSLGINVLVKALQAITPALETDFDIEIIEKHHHMKKDAPSGTALLLADAVNDVCQTKKEYIYGRSGNDNDNPRTQLGIHAVRGGSIPGEHTVLYAGEDEIIELKHTALSRDIFAHGALKAAIYLAKQTPGLYNMQDLLA